MGSVDFDQGLAVYIIKVLMREGVPQEAAEVLEWEYHQECAAMLDSYVEEHAVIPIRGSNTEEEAVAYKRALEDLDVYIVDNVVPGTNDEDA